MAAEVAAGRLTGDIAANEELREAIAAVVGAPSDGSPVVPGGWTMRYAARRIAQPQRRRSGIQHAGTGRYCGGYGSGQVDIGELRFGYPHTAYEVSQGEVAWPWTTVYPGQSAEAHPVDLRLTSSKTVTVSQPSVTGPDAADFPIRKQNCTGTLTATGCTVWVGFAPKARGPRHAELIVPTSAGSASVSLDGRCGRRRWASPACRCAAGMSMR